MLSTIRVVAELPEGFRAIAAAASAEGMNGPQKILASWEEGSGWPMDGAALFAAYWGGQLAGLGGVTQCPDVAEAARMRRFYVLRAPVAAALDARSPRLSSRTDWRAAPGNCLSRIVR